MGGLSRGRKASKMPENNYEVERIVDNRIIKGKVQYKVHWEGYGTDEETWENESQLDCPDLLEEYIAAQNNQEENNVGSSTKKEKSKSRSSKSAKDETPKEVAAGSTTAADDDATKTSFAVEKILDDRMMNGKRQYKIHWLGYSTDEETWEDSSNLNCPDLIKKYEKSKSSKKTDPKKSDLKKKSGVTKPPKKKLKPEEPEEAPRASEEEYEVERILDMHTLKNGNREFLVKWVGYPREESTWEPERNLEGTDLLKQFLIKVEKAKEISTKELRVNRQPTDRFTVTPQGDKRRLSKRYANKQRIKYYETE